MTDYALVLSDAELQRYRMMAERARVEEADAWHEAGIVPGARVADVGCGPGAALVAMAGVVGSDGAVHGVDGDPHAVEIAHELIAQSGLPNAAASVGAADDTGLERGAWDVVVMRHVLAHNGGREQAIVQHLASLVRPGGCVYLVDVEMTAVRMLQVEPEALELHERYVGFHRARGNDPQVGLRLGMLLAGAGLDVVQHSGFYAVLSAPPGLRPPSWAARDAMVAAGEAGEDDVQRWEAAFARSDAASERPLLFMPTFSATGRRPA